MDSVPPNPEAPAGGPPAWTELDPAVVPDLDNLVTQDDTPVESIFAEKQQRLLTEPLYASWAGPGEGRPFLALANVGYFYAYRQPPLVTDVLLALDAAPSGDLDTKEGHSYFQWLQEKPPEVIIEIVSDRRGGEEGFKQKTYARQGVLFYIILDPEEVLGGGVLRAFVLERRAYQRSDPSWLPEVGLGLKLWEGTFEGVTRTWLRWCDRDGRAIPTGAERAAEAERRADEEHRRADEERRRADEATAKAERLAAKLRSLGVEPEA
jgi:hypothetical protein